jgi:hypothetical protein
MNLSANMILVSVALLSALLLWWEYRRSNTARRWLRCIAVIIALGSLAALAYPAKKSTSRSSIGIMLTSGYDKDSLAAIKQQYPAATVYTPENYFVSGDTSISTWHILGYGLEDSQLSSLNSDQIFFHPTSIATGITYSSWQQQLNEDDILTIQGNCANKENSALQMVLEGYGTQQDSISIPARTTAGFVLNSAIKHRGQAVFRLKLKQGNKLLENNAVPFTTAPSKKIRLLVLSSAPDFEYRFLQNWLGKAGYPSAIRTSTSRDRFEQVFINRPSLSLRNISASLLDSFDVILGDIAAIDALSENERTAIRQQVADKGLGLLLRADTISASRFYTQGVALQSINANAQQTISLKLTNTNTALSNLPAPTPIIVKKNTQLNDWITDAANNSLVAASLFGMGKIAISTLDNTYQWILSGQEAVYSNYWSFLLRSAAKQETSSSLLNSKAGIYTKHQPIPVDLVYADTLLPTVAVNNTIHLPLQQQNLPFLWRGTFWPLKEGWQEVTAAGNTQYLYVYSQHDWPMMKASKRRAETTTWAKQVPSTALSSVTGFVWEKWWFLALFLLAAGFLWVERKYFV